MGGTVRHHYFILILAVFALASLTACSIRGGESNRAFRGPFNTTYRIENQSVALSHGRAEVPAAPGSAARVITTAYGEPVFGDLNRDGRDDAALFLRRETGGTGTFYYIAAAIFAEDGFEGTNAVLLGDRVVPQVLCIQNGLISVKYKGREMGQPMSEKPSILKTMTLGIDDGVLTVRN